MGVAKVAVAVLVGLLWQGAAHAQAPAPLRVTSGTSGALELRSGDRRLAELRLTTPPARRGEPRLLEALVEGRRVVQVQTPIKDEAATEVWIGSLGPSGASTIWTGRVGAVDRDGEISQHLDVAAEGLALYQSAARISRCDGQRVRLSERRFDFGARRWKPVATALPPPTGPVIVAQRGGAGAPAGRPRVAFPFTASSAPPVGAAPGEVNQLVAPLALNDGDPETVWAEGDPGDGRGEILISRSGTAGHSIVGLRVLPGDTRSADQFAARARARALQIVLGPGPEHIFEVTLDDREPPGPQGYRKPFWIPLPRPVASACVTVVIREVTPGRDPRERATAAWGDIDVFTDLDGEKGVERLVAALEGPDCEPRVTDVVALGTDALGDLAAAAGRAQGAALDCVLDALGRMAEAGPFPAAESRPLAAALPKALRTAAPTQERPIVQLLARLPEPPIAPLSTLLRDGSASTEERTRAARALAALATGAATTTGATGAANERPEVWPVLIAQVGQGPPELRAVLRGLGASAPASAGDAVQSALRTLSRSETARRADLVWLLGALAGRPGTSPSESVGNLLSEVASDEREAFEVRARALMVLGSWPTETAIAPLVKVRASSPDAALRTVAARSLAARPEAAAAPALRAAVDDGDPGVRQVAVEAVAARVDRSATPLLIAAAKQEPWPAVRRAEIAALGRLCGAGAGDLIVRAIERDVDEVRRAALRGLVSCRDRRAPALLLSVLSQPREKPPLRTQAALLLAELKDPGTATGLAEALDGLLVEAQSDLALEATSTGTLRALAEVGGPVALRAALRLRTDPRPVLRRSASEALGKLCDPGAGAEALRAATRDPDAAVAAAATAALRRCGSARRPR